jgi:predicted nicotinamide N-methyase
LVKEKTVLDIGAGSGIVGLSTLLPLASKVDFKEIGPFATASI